ncbi:hypothetical protein H9Q69_011211 [Fusarium xylarioides]|uniref:Uncharacterized protein n=1 Tax=Fusarium xylarioides TaxID=221167 RepID=A0A9P7L2K6_9HYPO|nr:hypothetical protein H9Q70_010123 [Fusarium xylarioides]KAG5761769.1 hypothetical protein H9Q72_010112 [Fusarium xylarioides]KAG5773349.1 hypothetical protein H9Q73_012145 [Fusarium xylarioides]KAG5789736.1 hypothetical protein H9Q69_011211 [Fusarium xylarioides]KAG5806876.1 hypothetical protein H9Q71_008545 [Fusarium xylarioides]
MSDHLSVEDIDDVELPGTLQRLDDTQLSHTVQGLDSNQIPRILLAIKSMNDEQGQCIIQRLDPSKDTRIQTFGGVMFWGTNIQSRPEKPDHPTFCDKFPHKTSSGGFACDCGWYDSDKAVANIILSYYLLMKQDGVLWSHVEGGPNEYMCRACVNDKPGRFNTYDLNDFDAHMTKKHIVGTSDPDDSIRRSYRDYLGPRLGYSFEP